MIRGLLCLFALGLVLCVMAVFFVFNKGVLSRKRRIWLLFPFSQAAAVFVGLVYGWDAHQPVTYFVWLAFLALICMAVDLILLIALAQISHDEPVEEKAKYLESQVKLQKQYNRKYQKSLEEARAVRFGIVDIFHRVENNMEGSSGLEKELERLNLSAKHAREEKICDHPVVDAVLKLKLAECEHHGIRTTWRVVIPSDLDFPSVDLCALFSNLMDNALNACKQVEEGRRHVDVRTRVLAERLVVEVVNSCGDTPSLRPWKEPGFLDMPEEIPDHGWGFSILRGIAWSHDGSFQTSVEMREGMGRVFRATIILGLGGGVGEKTSSTQSCPEEHA